MEDSQEGLSPQKVDIATATQMRHATAHVSFHLMCAFLQASELKLFFSDFLSDTLSKFARLIRDVRTAKAVRRVVGIYWGSSRDGQVGEERRMMPWRCRHAKDRVARVVSSHSRAFVDA